MQPAEAAEAFDIAQEPESIRAMYGAGVHARQLLATRWLLERGVRFVQLWHGDGQPWDNHDAKPLPPLSPHSQARSVARGIWGQRPIERLSGA